MQAESKYKPNFFKKNQICLILVIIKTILYNMKLISSVGQKALHHERVEKKRWRAITGPFILGGEDE